MVTGQGAPGPAGSVIVNQSLVKSSNPAGMSLQDRNQQLAANLRDAQFKIHELEDRVQAMTIERDKIITDYEAYIEKLTLEKE